MITPEIGSAVSDPEVSERARRRKFTADYKLNVLERWDASEGGMERGALLRREGLYRSHISKWLEQRDVGALAGLSPRKRGRKPTKRRDSVTEENSELRKQVTRLERKLKRAELLLEIQKKTSEILGIPLKGLDDEEQD